MIITIIALVLALIVMVAIWYWAAKHRGHDIPWGGPPGW